MVDGTRIDLVAGWTPDAPGGTDSRRPLRASRRGRHTAAPFKLLIPQTLRVQQFSLTHGGGLVKLHMCPRPVCRCIGSSGVGAPAGTRTRNRTLTRGTLCPFELPGRGLRKRSGLSAKTVRPAVSFFRYSVTSCSNPLFAAKTFAMPLKNAEMRSGVHP